MRWMRWNYVRNALKLCKKCAETLKRRWKFKNSAHLQRTSYIISANFEHLSGHGKISPSPNYAVFIHIATIHKFELEVSLLKFIPKLVNKSDWTNYKILLNFYSEMLSINRELIQCFTILEFWYCPVKMNVERQPDDRLTLTGVLGYLSSVMVSAPQHTLSRPLVVSWQ